MINIILFYSCLASIALPSMASFFGAAQPKEYLTIYASSKVAIPTTTIRDIVTEQIFVTPEPVTMWMDPITETVTEDTIHTIEVTKWSEAPTKTLREQIQVTNAPHITSTEIQTKTIYATQTETAIPNTKTQAIYQTIVPEIKHNQYEITNIHSKFQKIPDAYLLHKRLVTDILIQKNPKSDLLSSSMHKLQDGVQNHNGTLIYTNDATKHSMLFSMIAFAFITLL